MQNCGKSARQTINFELKVVLFIENTSENVSFCNQNWVCDKMHASIMLKGLLKKARCYFFLVLICCFGDTKDLSCRIAANSHDNREEGTIFT